MNYGNVARSKSTGVSLICYIFFLLTRLAPRDANLDQSSKTLHKAPTSFLFLSLNKRLPQNLTHEFVLFSYGIASRRDRVALPKLTLALKTRRTRSYPHGSSTNVPSSGNRKKT